jgi:hypothetical protein
MTIRTFFYVVLLCSLSLPAMALGTAKDYLGFLTDEELKTLVSTGELTNIKGTVSDLPLWKKTPFNEKIRAATAGMDTTLAAEGIYLIDAPSLPRDELDLRIFKSFTAFTSMKGLEALSVSKGRMETFIFDAAMVDSADHSKRLPDPSVQSVPPRATYDVYEKEEQTGDSFVRFQVDFDAATDVFAVSLTNLTEMKYLFFTLVTPGHLNTYFFVVPCRDKLVLYGLTVAETARLFGLEKVKIRSFYNRMKALVSWFAANVK